MIVPVARLSVRVGEPFDNACVSLKSAFTGVAVSDARIEGLLMRLMGVPYAYP